MVAPRLIREVRRGESVVEEFPTRVLVEKICSDNTLAIAHDCLVETARTGTAASFFRDTASFRVAAKTGTAQYVQGVRRSDGYYYGSMVVYFPADNPKYTIMASMLTCRARGGSYYGAGLTGQVMHDIVYNIYYRNKEWHRELTPSEVKQYPSQVKGGHIASVRRVADKFSPRVSFDRRDGWGEVTTDTLKNVNVRSFEGEDVMPNVVGMGLRDAVYMLESRGLTVRVSGSGAVRSQSIPAGRKVKVGESVTITLK
jgi:cell division protein FtsI (penicillin-binding protein 3)